MRSTALITVVLMLTCDVALPGPAQRATDNDPWDELRRTFYARTLSNGAVYTNASAFDPPWGTWAPFYEDAEFHARAIACLDGFLQLPVDQVEQQPAVRRAILLRDLWPVFDAQTVLVRAKSDSGRQRQSLLRRRLASVMRRLELSDEEVKQLPDNYQMALDRQLYPVTFDESSPELPFLPPDLLDEAGLWVPFSFSKGTVGALGHVEHSRYRSVFVPFIRLPTGRQDTLEFLNRSSRGRDRLAPPEGTLLALVRMSVLPLPSSELAATNVMESLQLIVVDPPADHRFKFVLDREGLLTGGHGLRPVTSKDFVDLNSFESGGLHPHHPKLDADGEYLQFGRLDDPSTVGTPTLEHCVACHGPTVGSNLFANTARSGRAEATVLQDQVDLILTHKQQDFTWGMYQALRD